MTSNLSQCHSRVRLERLQQRRRSDVNFDPGPLGETMLYVVREVGQVRIQNGGVLRALFISRWGCQEDLAKGPRRGRTEARLAGALEARLRASGRGRPRLSRAPASPRGLCCLLRGCNILVVGLGSRGSGLRLSIYHVQLLSQHSKRLPQYPIVVFSLRLAGGGRPKSFCRFIVIQFLW